MPAIFDIIMLILAIGSVTVLPQVPEMVTDVTKAANESAEAQKFNAQQKDEESKAILVEARTKLLKVVLLLVAVAGGIVLAIITIFRFFKPKKK